MSAVFLDTVGLVAIWDEADQWHATAETAFARIMSERRPLVTTTFVLPFGCADGVVLPGGCHAGNRKALLHRSSEL